MRHGTLLILASIFAGIFVSIGVAAAQQVVAPTPEPVGSSRGENYLNYNIVNSFETGYRWSLVDGDLGQYRSQVNYRNGLRLLASSLTVNSKDGHGRFFDEIVLNTQGLGNDPYQSAMLRIQKNGLYRYDLTWRLNEYYNPGLVTSGGTHLMDTRHRLQDHDLTLLPQSKVRFHLGYSRNSQDGPALSTEQLWDSRGDIFPVFMDVHRLRNEFRLGADIDWKGFKLVVQRRWDDFREDSGYTIASAVEGATAGDGTSLAQFRRNEPYHGTSPAWMGHLSTNRKWVALSARATYVGGERGFVLDETAAGLDRLNAANRQVLVTGNARRPVSTGDFSVSLFPTERLSLTNYTAVHSTRIDGNSYYTEFNNASLDSQTVSFNYLGIRTVSNTTSATYRAGNWVNVYARYGYSNRLIHTIQAGGSPGTALDSQAYDNSNTLHTGGLGVRLRPVKPVTVNLDGEIGRNGNPLTPVGDKNYHTLNGRVEYRARRLQLSTTYRQLYNLNSAAAVSTYSAHSRNYSASASWFGTEWFSLDASYMKMHLDTVSGLAFFSGTPRVQLQTAYSSLYTSNIHAGNLGAHFDIRKRVDLYAGYTITRDAGDGRATQAPTTATDPLLATVLAPVQTFPLAFHAPLARVSVKLSPKLRWNAGWQFYRYREDFQLLAVKENYRAHTGYVSLSWSF
jgi:hypothetical protein